MALNLNLSLATVGLAALLGASHLLDGGPSEAELAAATAADLNDAIAQARTEAPRVRVELARIEAEDAQPTPGQLVQRYAALVEKR